MTRGKQKIEAQKKNAEKNQKNKGSQIEARAIGLQVVCPICRLRMEWEVFDIKDRVVIWNQYPFLLTMQLRMEWEAFDIKDSVAQLANQNQLVDHFGSKHPKEKPPSNSG